MVEKISAIDVPPSTAGEKLTLAEGVTMRGNLLHHCLIARRHWTDDAGACQSGPRRVSKRMIEVTVSCEQEVDR